MIYNRDRFYTVHNVWGASIGTGVLAHFDGEKCENQKVEDRVEKTLENSETLNSQESESASIISIICDKDYTTKL